MDSKTRLILVLLMSSVMVLMVTLLVTYLNLGWQVDFLMHWLKAYLIAWPVAAATGFLVMPPARRLTDWIVHRIEGQP
jgi:sterol desaturase/sphingolipid hydroxylase (fatty acid hydroxylase superfamily)